MMKVIWPILGFIVALSLIAAFYQAGPGASTFAFFLLVAGAVYFFLFR